MNNNTANKTIWTLSIVIPIAVALIINPRTPKLDLGVDLSFLAGVNASINSLVAIFLAVGFYFIKQGKYEAHKKAMLAAFVLSSLFLLTYVLYHLTVGHTPWCESALVSKPVYLFVLIPHIVLSGIIVPLALFTVYRGWTDDREKHRKIAKYTFPLWMYVAITGVLVYILNAPCH